MKNQMMIAGSTERTLRNHTLNISDESEYVIDWAGINADGNSLKKTESQKIKQDKSIDIQLLKVVDAAREDERCRLSRELHDQLGQDIVALALGLRALRKSLALDTDAESQLEQLQMLVDQLGGQIHDLASELRPAILDDLGLQMALASLIERWKLNSSMEVRFQSIGLSTRIIPSNIQTTVYRIIQEALTNISRHACASKVNIYVECNARGICATIADDGKGIGLKAVRGKSYEKQGLGLIGMRERVVMAGGEINIRSVPDKGTTVAVSIPFPS